ncbi:EAL domain-containing protein [Photobacterium indicum]|uniref:EAL domain-containing protein n=1 Tax=Photobacterium indicum TaxID=81447 RepID=UPI003D0E1C4C
MFKQEKILSRNKDVFAHEVLMRNSNSTDWNTMKEDDLDTLVTKQLLYIFDEYMKYRFKEQATKRFFINIERRQLFNIEFIKRIATLVNTMRSHGICIVFEITERGHVQPNDVLMLKLLKNEYGFSFAADDVIPDDNRQHEFSANIYDFIKLDHLERWIADVNTTKDWMYSIIETTSTQFIAEKIETHKELSFAMALPFDFFQGYFLVNDISRFFYKIKNIRLNDWMSIEK